MRCISLSALVAAAVAVLLSSAAVSQAGILLPQQISFDADDLERAFRDSHAQGTSSSSRNSQPLPREDRDRDSEKPDLLSPSTPWSNSSSSSSSSSAGGAPGVTVVLCIFNSAIIIPDDAALGRLAEDHGLSLPDPPGTDLLRPPRG